MFSSVILSSLDCAILACLISSCCNCSDLFFSKLWKRSRNDGLAIPMDNFNPMNWTPLRELLNVLKSAGVPSTVVYAKYLVSIGLVWNSNGDIT